MISPFNFPIFALSTAALLLTPGPTNTLLMAIGMQRGTKGAVPFVACELFAYTMAILAWGAILVPLQSGYPWAAVAVRVASSIYLVYIATRMWRSAPMALNAGSGPIGLFNLFTATLLNPKALIFSSAIFPAIGQGNTRTYLTAMALFFCLCIPIGIAWTVFGAALANGRMKLVGQVTLQRITPLVLCAFSASIAWNLFY